MLARKTVVLCSQPAAIQRFSGGKSQDSFVSGPRLRAGPTKSQARISVEAWVAEGRSRAEIRDLLAAQHPGMSLSKRYRLHRLTGEGGCKSQARISVEAWVAEGRSRAEIRDLLAAQHPGMSLSTRYRLHRWVAEGLQLQTLPGVHVYAVRHG